MASPKVTRGDELNLSNVIIITPILIALAAVTIMSRYKL